MNRLTNPVTAAAGAASDRIAQQLAVPAPTPRQPQWRAQSLAEGAAGTALLHIERAHTGLGGWEPVRAWLRQATQSEVYATPDAGLYLGAPAVAFTVHNANANADGTGRYARAMAALDTAVAAVTHRRVEHANARITSGQRPMLAEYDLISGLTGIGAHLLRHTPGNDALERVLTYLVRLSRPLWGSDGELLPGWWTDLDPHAATSSAFPGGHANLGLAHGITGPLALLALAHREGIVVDGHQEAVERICMWLDAWRQDRDTGPWWPQWITRAEHHRGRVDQHGPLRPSWCYGTPGIARAQQLAALATGDAARQEVAEHALAACLADPEQLSRITDSSLCHGWAGMYQTAWRAAADATTPAIAGRLDDLADMLLRHAEPGLAAGFLEGDAGIALALHTAAQTTAVASGWDTCLLLA
jgi:hypothetical protein